MSLDYPLLSLDGGGCRGVLQARLLQRLEQRVPGLLAKPKLLAGTSIGGINALWIASGFKIDDLVQLYAERAKDIFASRGLVDRLTPDELIRADFGHEGIYGVLTDVFGDLRMEDLQRDVLIPTFDMRDWDAKFYERDDVGVLVRDVARMTSAAPTYWPSHLWSLDGGLFANNPSDSAVATALRQLRQAGGKEGLEGRISCLSIGTGEVPHQPPSPDPAWDAGLLHVAPLLLNVVMDGAVKASHFRTQQALNGRYHRLQPRLPSAIDLKDVGKIDELLAIADMTNLDETVAWIERVWGLTRAVAPA